MPDLIVLSLFYRYMNNNNDQSFILTVPGIMYYGFMRHVDRCSRNDKNVYTYYIYLHSINNILWQSC